MLQNMSHTEFSFDASSFWRRGLKDLDLFQCWRYMKSAVEFAVQNENSLTYLQQITCIPKAYVIHILSLTRSRTDPYSLLDRKRPAIITTCVVCCSRMTRCRILWHNSCITHKLNFWLGVKIKVSGHHDLPTSPSSVYICDAANGTPNFLYRHYQQEHMIYMQQNRYETAKRVISSHTCDTRA
jgi:hypothetical protein